MKINIKHKNFFLKLLPYSNKTVVALHTSIYLPEIFYKDYLKQSLSIKQQAILIHEKVHLKRQKSIGLFTWLIKYFLNSQFRYQEELLAIQSQFEYLSSKQVVLPINFYSQILSSWMYLRMVSYTKAKADLRSLSKGV